METDSEKINVSKASGRVGRDFTKVRQLCCIWFVRSPSNLHQPGYNLVYIPKLINRSTKCKGIMGIQTISFKCGNN
jgi:hypothetical protein